jgi:basic amino acid/polyamine antiporter, APA family
MSEKPLAELKHELGVGEFFTISFGSIIGAGWVVVLGSWLHDAGPGGSMLAFLLGGTVALVVGFCYAELGTLFTVSGGEVVYAYEIFGLRACFAVGWLLTLNYVATAIFEAVSVGWIADVLVPGLRGRVLYMVHGDPVHLGSLLLELVGMTVITMLNYLGIKSASRSQNALTYAKIGLAVFVLAVGVSYGKLSNLNPPFKAGAIGSSVFTVFLTTPFWMSGFNTISQVLGEKTRRASVKMISWMIFLSIGAATFFYCLVILACSMILPWKEIVHLSLPAASAFEVAFHSSLLFRAVLIVALLGNMTVWNGMFLGGARTLFALGSAQLVHKRFGLVSMATGVPSTAILFIACLSSGGIFLGRSAVLLMVSVSSTCVAVTYFFVCWGVIKMRGERPVQERGYRIPGGKVTAAIALLASAFLVFSSLYEPYSQAEGHLPIEWLFFIGWAGLGGLFWVSSQKARGAIGEQKRRAALMKGLT